MKLWDHPPPRAPVIIYPQVSVAAVDLQVSAFFSREDTAVALQDATVDAYPPLQYIPLRSQF